MKLNEKCDKCDLCVSNNFTPIESRGNIHSKFLIVLENPGSKEKRLGSPLIGKTGEMLEEYLKKYSLLNYCFITYSINCTTPRGRTPDMYEILACRYRLLHHLKVVNPIIVLLLGNSAVNSYFGMKIDNISKLNNKILIYNNTILMFGYHPSYVKHNNELYKEYDKLFSNIKLLYKTYVNPYIL
jgi:uracil-DNA glycosylase family 4